MQENVLSKHIQFEKRTGRPFSIREEQGLVGHFIFILFLCCWVDMQVIGRGN
jgi:hypothetical protein